MVKDAVRIEFLYWEDCPSHETAWDRLQAILKEKGLQAQVNRVQIQTEQDAQKWSFCGSPTIRVNGIDIDPKGAQVQPIALNCRIYHTPEGRVTPLPPEEMIREALDRALNK
jgi:hypothetical protein